MARSKSKSNAATARDPRRAEIFREARLLAAGSALLLLLVALLTADPERTGGGTVGALGNFLATWTFAGIGLTAFLLIPLSIYWLGLRFFRKGDRRPWERGGGLLLVSLALCAGLTLSVESSRYALLRDHGPGGALGEVLRDGLVWSLGSVGAFLFVVVAFLIGLALFTDWLVFEMAAETASAFKSLGPWVRRVLWPEPTAATSPAGNGTATKSPPRAGRSGRSTGDDAASEDEAPKPSIRERIFGRKKAAADDAAESEEDAPAPDAVKGAADDADGDEDDEGADEAEADAKAPSPSPAVRTIPGKVATPPKRKPLKRRKSRTGGKDYEFPPVDLLDRTLVRETKAEEQQIQANAGVLEQTLNDFRIDAQVVGYSRGPVVTMYEISLAAGVKVTKIHALSDDLAMALKAQSVRVVAPIPGKSTVGVEVPNPTRDDVRLRGLLETDTYQKSKAAIPVLVGVDAQGGHRIEDLAKMPHLLIAGATGSGKSVCINSILMSVLMTRTPEDVRMILVDPKQVELSFFARIPHLMAPVVTDMKRATSVLDWACQQMDERYDMLAKMQVRSIASFNELGQKAIRARCDELGIEDREFPVHLPYVVIVVDELADLMMTAGKEVEGLITRLAQKSRAVGIHVVLATQRPSTDVITGLIKANMPTRICFKVTSKVDSRVVLDQNGADKLLGQGDMLYLPPRSADLLRAQATFVSDAEVKKVCEFLADRHEPNFNRELTQVCKGAILADSEKDELYDQAVRVILDEQRGSASLLQRALEIGYTRASRLLDQMRKEGIVGAYKGSKASDVLMTMEEYETHVAAARERAVHTADDDYEEDDEDVDDVEE